VPTAGATFAPEWHDGPTSMSAAAVDRALAVLVVALAATGLLSLRAGDPDDAWLFLLHGLLAGALVLAIARKLEHSVPRAVAGRRVVRLALGLFVSLVAVAALSGGYLWVASGDIVWIDAGTLGRWTVLTLHAWAGLILVPLVLVHLLPKRWRLLRLSRAVVSGQRPLPRISRRALLAGGAMAGVGIGLWVTSAALELVRGGSRRFTGSRLLPAGSLPISTTFFGEPIPDVDAASWRLGVQGAVERPTDFDLAALRAIGEREVGAVLDCTSGWAVHATWRGVPLTGVLEAAGMLPTARRVDIRSVTGWATSIDIADLRAALLAWSVAGQPLPAANGAPLRLVLPDHRGLDWVKWVATITVV
jgi:DMSO/TMAO reductase YedYZ molybdopterin-dependent catalytic subunit